jgi:hypothetical protein
MSCISVGMLRRTGRSKGEEGGRRWIEMWMAMGGEGGGAGSMLAAGRHRF